MTKIAFIGLGNMGAPMARNLLKHQHSVKVFDIFPKAVDALVEAGAKAAHSFAEAAQDVDCVISMLPSGKHVKEVYAGENGMLTHAKPGTLFRFNALLSG